VTAADLLPTLGFLILFPLWFRLIGRWIYRGSGWQALAQHYRAGRGRGPFERIPRLILRDTLIEGHCLVRKDGDRLLLQLGLPFRLILPHPPLAIPLARIRMKGRSRGTIGIAGGGIRFEGFDPRNLG
jgi:hypothetical protein